MKLRFKKFRILPKSRGLILLLLFIIGLGFLIPQLVWADAWGPVAAVLGAVLVPIIGLIGKLLTVIIRLLLVVVQYNDFINSTAVSKGWIILRDVFNMFFVLVLLVIAFATVLKIEKYSYKRLLGAFLLAAVLVNFSKLICGIFIDIAQILMLTFVNAFKAVGEGNLIQMLGIESLMNSRKEVGGQDLDKEMVGALLLGLIMTLIALVVVGIITIIFVFRIVILWFLVLLSPLAFMASVLPVFQKYANQWWEKFTSQLIIGPVLAFFLWLSFAMTSEGDIYKNVTPEGSSQAKQIEGVIAEQKLGGEAGAGASKLAASFSKAGKPEFVLNFIIGIAMLIGSLMVAQQMGVAGGKLAGKAVNTMQAIGAGVAKMPLKGLGLGVKAAGMGLRRAATTTGQVIQAKTGVPVLPSEIKTQYKKARARVDRRRRSEFLAKRSELSDQREKHGWIGGTARFAGDVVHLGQLQMKRGRKNIDKAKEIREKNEKSITQAEKDKKRGKQGDMVNKRNLHKTDLDALNKGALLDKGRLIPLLNKAVQEMEGRADELDGGAEVEKDKKKGQSMKEEAQELRQEAERVKKNIPNISKKDKFTWNEAFQGNQNFENLVKEQLQTNLGNLQKEIKGIDVDLKAKVIVSPEEKQKLEKQLEKAKRLEKIGMAQMKSGKEIKEPYGPYQRRVAEAAIISEKLKELPETYEQSEYTALAQKARKDENDWAKYKAVLGEMSKHGDWNEILLRDKADSDTEGKDGWAHFIAKSFNKPYEDVQSFVHELGTIAMSIGQHRLDSPYIYSEVTPGSGVYKYKVKSPAEEQMSYLYYSGTPDQETRARKESRLGTFSERPIIDAEGNVVGRAPILDRLSKIEVLRSWFLYGKEWDRGRLNKDKVYYLGAPKTVEWMKKDVIQDIKPAFRKDFKIVVNKLERMWKALGRPDPEKVPPGKMAGP